MYTVMDNKIRILLSAVRQRDWCPMPKVSFVKWTTTRNGYRIYADEHGHKAFPIPEPGPSRSVRAERPRFEPIITGMALANGLRAGDHVKVEGIGTGMILLVTMETMVVQLDRSGYLLERPTKILQHQVTFVRT